MENSLKFIYENYSRANSFEGYWYAFENYLDMRIPNLRRGDSFRNRLQRLEEYLKDALVHHVFFMNIFTIDEVKSLAELQPLIFRERTGDTSAHEAFASDYSRYVRGQKPKEPISRLLNLLYTVRCNTQHGQKILPEEWEKIRKRNELIFSLTTPIISVLDELIITFFVADGIFTYGTLQHFETIKQLGYQVEPLPRRKIKGHLYDLGQFPGWKYHTYGWVNGVILQVPSQFRSKFVQHCDMLEGDSFKRRLVIVYDEENEDAQHIAWAYHYNGRTNYAQRIKSGIWKDSKKEGKGL